MGSGRGFRRDAARLGLRLHPGAPDRTCVLDAALERAARNCAAGGELNVLIVPTTYMSRMGERSDTCGHAPRRRGIQYAVTPRWSFPSLPRERERAVGREGRSEARPGWGPFLAPHPTRRSLSLTTCHPACAFRGGGIKRWAVGYHAVMPREGGASSTPSRTMTAEQRSLGVGWVERSDTHR